jgi:hypothetical protein
MNREIVAAFSFQGKKRIAMPVLSRFSGKILHERSECGDFSAKPRRGLTFTGQKRHGDIFAHEKRMAAGMLTYYDSAVFNRHYFYGLELFIP